MMNDGHCMTDVVEWILYFKYAEFIRSDPEQLPRDKTNNANVFKK